jgi:cation diffusion facilitator family transporter
MDRAPVRIAAISLAITACLLVLKLGAAIVSDSIAVFGDAVDSGADLAAGFAALVSVRIAAMPADEEHPYGHGKVESISAAVAATIVAIGGGFVVVQAIRRLTGDLPGIDVGVGLAAMVIAACVNAVVAFFMAREAKRSESLALKAESKHLETNVVQAGTIILGLGLVGVTGEEAFDPLFALGLAAYMGWTALGLVRTATSDIMDTSLPEDDIEAIRAVLAAHGGRVRGYHRLRTRRSGAVRHIDMHLLVDPGLSVDDAHVISDEIEQRILERLPGSVVVIHVEPGGAEAT